MPSIRALRWDPWNANHIAVHGVTLDDVEEVCSNDPMFSQSYGGRIRVIGPTSSGRILTVILAPEAGDVYYPITARPASRGEHRRYQEMTEGRDDGN